jgi:hypothetical protein
MTPELNGGSREGRTAIFIDSAAACARGAKWKTATGAIQSLALGPSYSYCLLNA